jgi:hypothetical protein
MNDWYNYFFSTTAQVLGCFLGLYGLFAVFRIQEIKREMLGLANSVKAALLRRKEVKTLSTEQEKLADVLADCILRENVEQALGMITDINDSRFMPMVEHYRKLYYFFKCFKTKTINTSIFAAIIIVLSLFLLIIGQLIPDIFSRTSINELHILISVLILASTTICIFLFISILNESMTYIKVDVPESQIILRRISDSIRMAEKARSKSDKQL